jgi:hypothetical protein
MRPCARQMKQCHDIGSWISQHLGPEVSRAWTSVFDVWRFDYDADGSTGEDLFRVRPMMTKRGCNYITDLVIMTALDRLISDHSVHLETVSILQVIHSSYIESLPTPRPPVVPRRGGRRLGDRCRQGATDWTRRRT